MSTFWLECWGICCVLPGSSIRYVTSQGSCEVFLLQSLWNQVDNAWKRRGPWIERLTGQMVHRRLECWQSVTMVLKGGGPVWNLQTVWVFCAQTGSKCSQQAAHFPLIFFWATGHRSYHLHLLIRPWWVAGVSSVKGTDVPSGQIGWKPDDSWIRDR